MIPRARVTPITETTTRKCKRCGVEREARRTTVLCRDCRAVLSADERKAWAA